MKEAPRNAPCPCGSGKRYKECCGRLPRADADAPSSVAGRMNEALAAQAGDPPRAEAIYREVLAEAPDLPDALHMLGVLRLERGDCGEAASLILRALDLTAWRVGTFRYNLGLVLARAYREQAELDRDAALGRIAKPTGVTDSGIGAQPPAVAIIVPSYNHAGFVERALESVFNQSYRRVELVVIDDGSSDDSAAIIARALAGSPFPHRFMTRSNRGAAATIDEAIALSTAPFVNVLNSDDWFSEHRIALMIERVAAAGADWGFSEVVYADDTGRTIDPALDRRAATLSAIARAATRHATAGFSFFTGNVAISSGNLFFSRALWQKIGGFGKLRYNHDWEFGLRALRFAEPVFVPAPTYHYRLHGANTISAAIGDGGMNEANRMLTEFYRWASAERASANPLAPTLHNWGMYFVCTCLNAGWAGLFERDTLRRMVLDVAGDDGGGAAVRQG